MIIYFDNGMNLHVDKGTSADNSFQLSKYGSGDPTMFFRANAVVDGHTVLFTHSQVTRFGGQYAYGDYCSNSTGRRHFLFKYLNDMEKKIATYLRKDRGYRGKITVRFCIGESTEDLFSELGYKYIKDSHTTGDDWFGGYLSRYVIVEKNI